MHTDNEVLRAARVLSDYCRDRSSCIREPGELETDCPLCDICAECYTPEEWHLQEPETEVQI